MAVPENIRKVPRPVNTTIYDNGRDGPNRYAVRARTGVKYVSGGNPQPQNGKVIGHIIDGVYVPVNEVLAETGKDMMSYGASAFVKSVTGDILTELLNIYSPKDAFMIMAIATLRVIKPSITATRMSTHYKRTFVSQDYPGLAMSPNSICGFLQRVGQDGLKRKTFYQVRSAAVIAEHHVAIDGTLKQDTSTVNDLSAFSYKSRIKGCKEVSVLYAYDVEKMEPICAEVFPGNSIDASSYPAFIRDNDLQNGIIVADKGFPPSMIAEELKERPALHFLTPIKRNDSRIQNNNSLEFDGILNRQDDQILYSKRIIKGKRFLYSFKSAKKAAAEEVSFLARRKKQDDFSSEQYTKKKEVFGVIVLESDQDIKPEVAYACYEDRWLLELVFKRYKSDLCLDKTNVQGDYSLIGSEFVNFIATLATSRMLRKARDTGLLAKMSFGELMDDLSSAWRLTNAPTHPSSGDRFWVHTLKLVFDELEVLGLSEPIPKPPAKKRGRPKKLGHSDNV